MSQLASTGHKWTTLSAILAGWAFIGLSLAVAVEVILRKVFAYSLGGMDEIGGYIYAISAPIGYILALRDNAHIRVDLILSRMRAPVRFVIHILSFAALGFFAMLLAWRGFDMAFRSWQLGSVAPTPMQTPLVIPQSLWLAGTCVFVIVIAAKILGPVLSLLKTRNLTAATRALDVAPIDAELQQELQSIEARGRNH